MTLYLVLTALVGFIAGSVANIIAFKIESERNIDARVHCPSTDSSNVVPVKLPIVSWLRYRAKCPNCKSKISLQYPFVEVFTAIVFCLMTTKVDSLDLAPFSYNLTLLALLLFSFSSVILAVVDQKIMILPTKIIYYSLLACVVLLSASSLLSNDVNSIFTMLIGAGVSFAFYFIIWFIKPGGIGFGDVRLALLTGSILGWLSTGSMLVGIVLPFAVLAIIVSPLLVLKIVNGKTKLPFGPWIILGAFASVIWGDIIVNAYLKLGGFS